jgi:hypothetical protein
VGLDITWYRDIKPAPDAEVDEGGYPVLWEQFVRVPARQDFQERGADIAPGVYSAADKGGFRAGSYGGYGEFRRELASLAGYSPEDIWAGKVGMDKPFAEMVNFTDCDGFIGTEVSKKLADDFAEHQAKADAIGDYFAEKYTAWRNAFEQARHGGFVDFH